MPGKSAPPAMGTDGTQRLAISALLLMLMLAGFLFFCIQAGQDGAQNVLRKWQWTLFGSFEHHDAVVPAVAPAVAPVATPTRPEPAQKHAASVAPAPVAKSPPQPAASASGRADEPAKVAAALRSALQIYKSDAHQTSTVTLTTGGAIQSRSASAPTALDGVPIQQLSNSGEINVPGR